MFTRSDSGIDFCQAGEVVIGLEPSAIGFLHIRGSRSSLCIPRASELRLGGAAYSVNQKIAGKTLPQSRSG